MFFRPALLALATLLVINAHGAQAHALDGGDVGRTLAAAFAANGIGLQIGKVVTRGDGVTLEDSTVFRIGREDEGRVLLGTLKLESVTVAADGGYRAARGALDGFQWEHDPFSFKSFAFSIEDLVIAGDPEAAPAKALLFSAQAGPFSVEIDGRTVLSAEELLLNHSAEGGIVRLEDALWGIVINPEAFFGDWGAMVAKVLGQDRLQLGLLNATVEWDMDAHKLDVAELIVRIDGVGMLGARFEIGGYSPDFVRAYRAQDMAWLQAAYSSKVTFNSGLIYFEDHGGLQKMLDYLGAENGVSASTFADFLIAMLPTILAPAIHEARRAEIAHAIASFLDQRGIFYLTLDPSRPMTIAEIVTGLVLHPKTLAEQLDLSAARYDR